MENFNFFSFLVLCALFFNVVDSQGCGKYCVCSMEQTDCYFTRENEICYGEVPVLETYILNIYGPVCSDARSTLKTGMFHNMVKVLHNDICGTIPNCR